MMARDLQRIDSYTVLQVLKQGPGSSLYLARAGRAEESVLLRVFATSLVSGEVRQDFLAYAERLQRLRHPNIAEVLDHGVVSHGGRVPDRAYLVIRPVSGGALRQRFTPGRPLPLEGVSPWFVPVARALQFAHQNGVVHGNLHPWNVLIGESDAVYVTDFAPPFREMVLSSADQLKALMYRAPEHLRGEPCPASDQYSLAVMVYEWVCGHPPYDAKDPEVLLRQQEHMPLHPLRWSAGSVSPAVEAAILRALARNPAARFPTVQAFANVYAHALVGIALPPEEHALPLLPVLSSASRMKRDRSESPARKRAPVSPRSLPAVAGALSGEAVPFYPTALPFPPDLAGAGAAPEGPGRSPVHGRADTSLRDAVLADLGKEGVLSLLLPGYEERAAQIQMATLVAQAISDGVPALIEAGTGTGKTHAYLIPIIRSGRVAVISTANKALQEQIFYKDIPFLQRYIEPFEAALVKGMNNYVCLDRLHNEFSVSQRHIQDRAFLRLFQAIQRPESAFDGDFETLDFPLAEEVRRSIWGDSNQCSWSKCPFFSECYIRAMRERASQARIIVVNHTLLLLDAVMGGGLLPEHDITVLDEAHHLEEEATRAFTIAINPAQVSALLALRQLKEQVSPALQGKVTRAVLKTWAHLDQLADLAPGGRATLRAPVEEGLRLAAALSEVVEVLRRRDSRSMDEREGALYERLLKRAEALAQNVYQVFSLNQAARFVYFLERVPVLGQRDSQLQVCASPVEVASWLDEGLFQRSTVICASATLTTVDAAAGSPPGERGATFSYFRRSIGIDADADRGVLECILPLTFDYQANALLYLPKHLPEPAYGEGGRAAEYVRALAQEMLALVKASRGRAFLLFSSKRMLDVTYDAISPHLEIPLLRQGELPRSELTRRFKESPAVLFGLKSFWEGVDIPGEALSLVVIDKLPFDPPDDPVHEARVARMKAAGENWFGGYVLPQTVLRLKQGLGRLLRTRADRGVMALLDTRLYTRNYGKSVIEALPPARRTASLQEVVRFFDAGGLVGPV